MQQQPTLIWPAVWLASLFGLAACGGSGPQAEAEPTLELDAQSPVLPAASMDAGSPVSENDPLTLRLEVSGAQRSCGSCALITAKASGGFITDGSFPYSYEWSDPTLKGPGPHEVCGDELSHYSVTVSDQYAGAPDAPSGPRTASAEVDLPCEPANGDAGTFSGCKVLASGSIFDLLSPEGIKPPEGAFNCYSLSGTPYPELQTDAGAPDGDAGEGDAGPPVSGGIMLSFVMKAGATYQFRVEFLFPLVIGTVPNLEVWSADGCNAREKLGEIVWNGIDHFSGCLLPTRDVHTLMFVVPPSAQTSYSIGIVFGASETLCAGCATP